MRLTTHTDFALRMLMYLATSAGRATAAQVARLYGVSSHHMAKVVQRLARLGYVRSVRGVGGGIELARPPAEIRLGERSLLEYVLAPFQKAWHEAARER